MGEYSKKDGAELLSLARQSIDEASAGEKPDISGRFIEKRGVFVTLTKKGELRGCIGLPYPTTPLAQAVVQAAKSAAFSDPRFAPVGREELKEIKIEISILSVPKHCKPDEVEIGKDGIICEYNGYSGLFLPQVAVEYKMNREEFLDALCEKAGLRAGMWKDSRFKLYKFQAQIFSE